MLEDAEDIDDAPLLDDPAVPQPGDDHPGRRDAPVGGTPRERPVWVTSALQGCAARSPCATRCVTS